MASSRVNQEGKREGRKTDKVWERQGNILPPRLSDTGEVRHKEPLTQEGQD